MSIQAGKARKIDSYPYYRFVPPTKFREWSTIGNRPWGRFARPGPAYQSPPQPNCPDCFSGLGLPLTIDGKQINQPVVLTHHPQIPGHPVYLYIGKGSQVRGRTVKGPLTVRHGTGAYYSSGAQQGPVLGAYYSSGAQQGPVLGASGECMSSTSFMKWLALTGTLAGLGGVIVGILAKSRMDAPITKVGH